MSERLLIVLDLDETLFHSWEQEIEERPADFRIGHYHVYQRPGAAEFVHQLLANPEFEVAIWTAATNDYAELALKGLGFELTDFAAVFTRSRCTQTSSVGWEDGDSGQYLIKDLRKLLKQSPDWCLERTIAIDDFPRSFERQYSNLLRVEPYQGDAEPQPNVFPSLLATLERLARLPDVRPVEKRGWYAAERRRTTAREPGEAGPAP